MPTPTSLWLCKERGFAMMVTDHRSHRDTVESPHLRIFIYHLDMALGNLLQVTCLDPADQVISEGHFPLQPICFCKNKELQGPVMHQTRQKTLLCCVLGCHRRSHGPVTCPMQQMGHAALPYRAGVRWVRGTACTFAGNTQREIPHLDTG